MPHGYLQAEGHLPASLLTPGPCSSVTISFLHWGAHTWTPEAALVGMFLWKDFCWYLNFLALRLGVSALLCPYRRYNVYQAVH